MDAENGFALSPELRALRDQVGKIIREEIIPIEARCDPDAPEIPEDDYWRIARKAQAAGMWCMDGITFCRTICRRSFTSIPSPQ